MDNKHRAIVLGMALAMATPQGWAHPGARFWLGAEAGQIVTYREVMVGQYAPAQVFTQPLEEIVPNLWATEFPGYEVRSGGNVASGTTFGIRLSGPLLRYNPATSALEEMIQSGTERVAVTSENQDTIITSTGVTNGYNFFTHVDSGDHAHLFYTLYGDGQTPGGGANGAYVLPLQLTATGYAMSDWYFLVLDKNAPPAELLAAQSVAQDMADAIAGDANFDGVVNLQDFNRLAANFGGNGLWWGRGDFNFDGQVNLPDFNALAGNFGASAPTSIPEPGSAAVLCAGLIALLRRRSPF
jgi:hypothetical protein